MRPNKYDLSVNCNTNINMTNICKLFNKYNQIAKTHKNSYNHTYQIYPRKTRDKPYYAFHRRNNVENSRGDSMNPKDHLPLVSVYLDHIESIKLILNKNPFQIRRLIIYVTIIFFN